MKYQEDQRIVMTLDAGGTNFRFSAIQGNVLVVKIIAVPSNGDNLDKCLSTIIEGFERVKKACPAPPTAISFAFPGPADYPNGIIGNLTNLPSFQGGVALGAMLRAHFGIPVFINNDGDLFAYGEAIAGFLPYVNDLLAKAGSPKRYHNLFAFALGTGFGGGIVRNGELFLGDNSMAAEIWDLRHGFKRDWTAEEGASIRAVRREYAEAAGIPFEKAPQPKDIFEIGQGKRPGPQAAAIESFRRLGQVVGDAMAECLTIVDGLGVIGGGISGAWPLFLPSIIEQLNSSFHNPDGTTCSRIPSKVFNLEDPAQLQIFLRGEKRELAVHRTGGTVTYDPLQRLGVGISRLGTSEAVAIGAYAFALRELDHGQS